ncbi:hypothetical protein BH09BAC5_BH09BAC5_22620 [soil metagenome]
MKRNIYYAFCFLMLFAMACKKDAGTGGKKTISGTVHYLNGATGEMEIASGATVMISYGTKTYNSNYDQMLLTDSNGNYHLEGIRKGDYFFSAEFTDAQGFSYTTAGYGVTVQNKKDVLTLDIDLR